VRKQKGFLPPIITKSKNNFFITNLSAVFWLFFKHMRNYEKIKAVW
jgi:hypothetical protein